MNLADAIGWAGCAISLPGHYFYLSAIRTGSPEKRHLSYGFFAVGCWLGFVASVLEGSALGTAILGLLAAIHTWLWWKNRRNGRGKRALKDLGAKSRARIEAMVRQMTPSPIPSPVGGAA